jgi:hypothetical protein
MKCARKRKFWMMNLESTLGLLTVENICCVVHVTSEWMYSNLINKQ